MIACRRIRKGEMPSRYFLNGDDAYPGSEQMLTPFPGKSLPAREDDFNFYQSKTRIRIEMAFGRLVQRFGILWRPLRCKLEFVPALVMSCMILHNLCFDNDCSKLSHLTTSTKSVTPLTRVRPSSWIGHGSRWEWWLSFGTLAR
jgi:hypothetical protein